MASSTFDLELPGIPPTDNPALTGWRAPVRVESTSRGPFGVAGAIPRGLEGRLMWLGPNPILVSDPDHYRPSDGDGMVHALEIRDGAPTEFRSRFVVTRHVVDTLGARPPEGPLNAAGPLANAALVHVASRILALDGRGLGYRVTLDLRTACVEDFDAMLATPMGTQVIIDPETRDAVFLGVDQQGPPYLRLHALGADGILAGSTEIAVDSWLAEPALGLTQTSAVIAESSLASPVLRGDDDVLRPLRFDPEYAPRVGLLAKGEDGSAIEWSTSQPGHVHRILSAADTPLGARCVVLRSSPENTPDPSWWPSGPSGHLELLDVSTLNRGVTITRLDDLVLDAVTADPLAPMASRRFAYGVTTEHAGDEGGLLVKYDLTTGHAQRRSIPETVVADQPLFVRDPEGRTDEEGWVVVPLFDRSTDSSQLMVLDATRFSGQPESIITLPARLPFGVSGLFLAPNDYR